LQQLLISNQILIYIINFNMPFFSTQASIDAAYTRHIGAYDYACFAQHQDSRLALFLPQLKSGESVLEVGAGSGRFIAEAKLLVDASHCVAVDAVQGFITQDIHFTLHNKQLLVAPNGGTSTQVHCVRSNITRPDFASTIPLPPVERKFDCIVAVHVFTTLSPDQRAAAFVTLRKLLKDNGRLIVNVSARFAEEAPLPVRSVSLSSSARPSISSRLVPTTRCTNATIALPFRLLEEYSPPSSPWSASFRLLPIDCETLRLPRDVKQLSTSVLLCIRFVLSAAKAMTSASQLDCPRLPCPSCC
jgi:SAM-dependent methyltransferase